jgi:osmotically-inducible protein OsmY
MLFLMPRGFGADVRDAVLREIAGDPSVRPSEIGVSAEDGLVTLTGCVGSCGVKVAVERAAKRVPGVRTIANDLHVTSVREQRDTDIAREALHRLRNNRAVPPSVQAVVSDGFITLDGIVSVMHQRLAAERAVKSIDGVTGVANNITLQSPLRPPQVEGSLSWHV